MPNISVIIPTYNRVDFLKKAIDSVFSQTYKDFELIVVDDGSTDETKDLIKRYSHKIKYIYQANQGPAASRNTGIKQAKGNFIAFLDSDDWWRRDKLEAQIDQMRSKPSYLISHTQEIWYRDGKILNPKDKHKKYSGMIFDRCLKICAVGMSTIMARRELFPKVGLFDERLPCCEDYDLWLRASANFPFLLIDQPLTLKDGGRPDQLSFRYAQGIDKFRIYSIKKILEEDNLTNPQRQLAIGELDRKCRIYGQGCIKHHKIEEGNFYLKLAYRFNLKPAIAIVAGKDYPPTFATNSLANPPALCGGH
jgi:glycosyltransferase involved in cell wall biosynthesis